MITAPRILSVAEARCARIGAKLHDDTLNGYELVDLETSLRLIEGALARYLRGPGHRQGGSVALCSAHAAHNRMRDRLVLVDRYRDELLIAELRGFLREAQGHALDALLALGKVRDSEFAPVLSHRPTLQSIARPAARYTPSELRMGIGRTRR